MVLGEKTKLLWKLGKMRKLSEFPKIQKHNGFEQKAENLSFSPKNENCNVFREFSKPK